MPATRLFASLALAFCTVGCATPKGEFGMRARYSPAFRGYVLAKDSGSDDPGVGEKVLVLRHPLTGNKLRCREHVVEWREVNEDVAADRVQDKNAAVVAATTSGVVFAPLLAMQPVGGLVLTEAMLVTGAIYDDLASDDPRKLLAKGRHLFERTRYTQASRFLERALAKDASIGVVDMAYFYLGRAYYEMKRFDRARLALSLFVDRAGVRDVEAYRKAEEALDEMGVAPNPCKSNDAVKVHW